MSQRNFRCNILILTCTYRITSLMVSRLILNLRAQAVHTLYAFLRIGRITQATIPPPRCSYRRPLSEILDNQFQAGLTKTTTIWGACTSPPPRTMTLLSKVRRPKKLSFSHKSFFAPNPTFSWPSLKISPPTSNRHRLRSLVNS